MKVCLVGPAYPYRGGIAHFTSLLANEFSKDHDTMVINFRRLYPSIFFPGKTQFDESKSAIRFESQRIIDSINPVSYFKAALAVKRFGPDILIFQWWHPFFAPVYFVIRAILKIIYKCRVVYICHNVLPHESSFLDRLLISLGFLGVNAFLVQSSEDKERLIELKGGGMKGVERKITVHPHPIYDVFQRGRFDRDQARQRVGLYGNIVLFFGYVRRYKGLEILIRAFARAKKSYPLHLLIVGEFYEDREKYDMLIEQLGILQDVVIIDRYVPNEEVEIYFEASDVVALPYISATQSGIVQIAYAFNKPVIVTSVGGLPDVVEDGKSGLVVPPEDPESLADALVRFFREDMKESLSLGIDSVKERFSWKGCVEALMNLASGTG